MRRPSGCPASSGDAYAGWAARRTSRSSRSSSTSRTSGRDGRSGRCSTRATPSSAVTSRPASKSRRPMRTRRGAPTRPPSSTSSLSTATSPTSPGGRAMPDETPYRNFNFRVEFAGLPEMAFRDVVLPETRIELLEYRVGSDPSSRTRKLPGRALTGNVVLKRGIDHDLSLWAWFKNVRDGNADRRDGFIALHDAEGTEVRRWNISRALPVAYEPSALHALKSEVAIETLELACEAFDIDV